MDSLFINDVIVKSQQRFRSDHDRLYTADVNKIALSSNDDKRLQTYDRITTYPYGTHAVKVCESQMNTKMMMKMKMQNETCESEIDNVDNVDNMDMQNEICESKIGNMDIVNISNRSPKIKVYE